MNLAQLFTHNYEYLNTVAKRITRCKDYRMAPDLMNCTYLYINDKECEYPKDNDDFVKWFSTYMKNFFTWPNSDFNKTYTSKESLTVDTGFWGAKEIKSDGYNYNGRTDPAEFLGRCDERLVDEDALRDIELMAEGTNDFTKEIIGISSSLGKGKTLKYIETVEFKRCLSEPDKILFELYFEKELSTRKIAQLYSDQDHEMNYQSVNNMVNKIKDKLKKYEWKH